MTSECNEVDRLRRLGPEMIDHSKKQLPCITSSAGLTLYFCYSSVYDLYAAKRKGVIVS